MDLGGEIDFGHPDFQISLGEHTEYCDLIGCYVEFSKSNWLVKAVFLKIECTHEQPSVFRCVHASL